MKKIILLFAVLFCIMHKESFGQQTDNKRAWAQIDSLEKRGLYRSAWNRVKQIYNRAVENQDDQQQLKALIYQLKYRSKIEEAADDSNFGEVDSLASRSSGIKQAVLQSMLAEMYWHYVQANRYTMYDRIPSAQENDHDISTWSLEHFYEKIAGLYRSSLQHESMLKKIELKSLVVLVDTGKNTLALQPSLYDLLAHRALEYFTGEEQNVVRPATRFMIDRAAAFDPALTFSAVRLPGKDTADLSYQALILYKQLIQFHLYDKDPAALIDVDLQRLQFVYRKAVMAEKDSLYLLALEHIVDQYGNTASARAVYLLAQWHYDQGIQYDAITRPGGKDELNKALALCESIASLPVSNAVVSARQLRDNILRPALSLQAEQVNVPGEPFRVLVTYKNAAALSFRLVKLPEDAAVVFANKNPDLSYLLGQKAIRSWQQVFPDQRDHQNHRAEMKMDALPHGRYALLVSDNNHFERNNSPVESVLFYVSRISYVQNGQAGFLVLNRETGEPLRQATVRLWNIQYNQDKRRNEIVLFDTCHTDRQGSFRVKAGKTYYNLMPEIDWEGDHLFTGQPQWIPYAVSGETEKDTVLRKTYLFTDRSIYRPGQTVWFKGITFNYALPAHQGKAAVGTQDTILMVDGNNQKIDSLPVVSNDYGSYAGSFVLPKTLLHGVMTLRTANGEAVATISVEDYKRPTFYVQWDTASQQYRLGDTVNIRGNVLAYSQAVIDGATVQYRVTRRTRVVFPWYRGRGMIYPPRTETASIAQGEAVTDGKGNFNIRFPAIPDETTDSAWNPVFVYVVSVDVTDLNGESHPFSYELPLGYKSLELQWHTEDKISVNELDSIGLSSTTPAGTFTPTSVQVRLYPLAAPERYIRPRYWQQPDEFIMDKADYLENFPHDEYKNESDPETWEKAEAVYSGEEQTDSRGIIRLHAGKLRPGWYALEATARDKDGQEVKAVKYLQLYEETKKKPLFQDPFWVSKTELESQPGRQANWLLSAEDKIYLFSQDERPGHIGEITSQSLNDEVRPIDFNVDETDYGGVLRHYLTVKYNRVFTEDIRINVPWRNKQLHIQYETFRDKLLPGEEEKWRLKITGEQGDKVSAELLASMYDASLDAFRQHRWNLPDIYPINTGKINWHSDYGFNEISSYRVFDPKMPEYPVYSSIYPSLNWFGYEPRPRFPSPIIMYARGASAQAVSDRTRSDQDALFEKRAVAESAVKDSATTPAEEPAAMASPVRKNFNETAFFFPQLHTDDSGSVVLSFTMPEALTRWKLMLLAHTGDMQFAFSEKETVTRKPLMIQANAPRFVRQGDEWLFSAKVSNTSPENLNGNARLELTDLTTGESVNGLFKHEIFNQAFTADAGQSASVKWALRVPEHYAGVLSYKITAVAGDYSDGEQNALPVLTNRALVTESLPLYFTGNGDHDMDLPAVKQLDDSHTLQPLSMMVEYAGNPIWYAVQALPFLDEAERESADACFNQVYANLMGRFIATHIPQFGRVMQQWLTRDTDALKSPLQQNDQLKSVVLAETPWVENAARESAQKEKIAEWFDHNKMTATLDAAITKLKALQLSNGGFSWFKGMPDDRYMTQRVLTGIGRLMKLRAISPDKTGDLAVVVQQGIPYVDARMKEAYDALEKDKDKKGSLNAMDIQYLYLRSFFPEVAMADSVKAAYRFYQKLAGKYWTDQPVYLQAMIALVKSRLGDKAAARAVLKSLSETAVKDPVKGMHWKADTVSYRWYQAPVESQSVCIEAFEEIDRDQQTADDLRNWLLSQKQAQSWATDAATADAVYALLLTGTAWESAAPQVTVQAGRQVFTFDDGEAGTRYSRKYVPGKDVSSDMGKIKVHIAHAADHQPTWGAVYFQYLEHMDKLSNTGGVLHVDREVLLERATPQGPKLVPVTRETPLKVGDKVQIRLVVRADQDMDYVHLKDVRASCMEPLQTLSGYHWQGGTGYYSEVTDAAVHDYFSHLSKGTYVFTYPVYITHAGDYTGGMSTLECLYAPSMRAHSEGIKIQVDNH